jgi:hypothetical protein
MIVSIKANIIYCCCFSLLCSFGGQYESTTQILSNNEARQIAIQDFSKNKLFTMDSVFSVKVFDTLHRATLKKISDRNYAWVNGKAYPEIIALNIVASSLRYFLDTTEKTASLSKNIPSGVFEKDGRVFLWWDDKLPLTEDALKVLDKFHLVQRGGKKDFDRFSEFRTINSTRAVDYYFCRNNISVYKRLITGTAIGHYEPPNITCK